MSQRRRLVYLSLEAPREGQASFAHVHEIVKGLERRGWTIDLLKPVYSDRAELPVTMRRIVEHMKLDIQAVVRLGRTDILFMNRHPPNA